MTVAAILLVKDEADVIEWTLRHLHRQDVDAAIVADNGSTDGTREILDRLVAETDGWLAVQDDPEVGYWQSAKTTALAHEAHERGFDWVIPCDADEMWVAADGRTVGAWLRGVPPDVLLARAALYNYVPTAEDPADSNPFTRIGWRLAEPAPLGKVACRLRPDLTVEAGNHGASYDVFPLATNSPPVPLSVLAMILTVCAAPTSATG